MAGREMRREGCRFRSDSKPQTDTFRHICHLSVCRIGMTSESGRGYRPRMCRLADGSGGTHKMLGRAPMRSDIRTRLS